MQTQLTAPFPKAEPRRARRWLIVSLTVVGLLVLGAAIGARVATGMVRERMTGLAARYGLELEVGSVELSVFSGIGVADVRAFANRDGQRHQVGQFARIDTDLSLIDAIGGARRPNRLEVHGGALTVRWDDGLVDLGKTDTEHADPDEAANPTTAIELALHGVDLFIEARHTTPMGPVTLAPFSLKGLTLDATRHADRALSATGKARLDAAGRLVDLAFALDTTRGTIAITLGEGAELVAETPRGQATLTARTLEVGPRLQATDLGLALGELRVGARRLSLAPSSAPTLLAALETLHEPAPWATLELEGFQAERGATAGSEGLSRVARADKVVAELRGGAIPRPTALSTEGAVFRWLSSSAGLEVDAQTGKVELGLSHDLPLEAMMASPLTAVTRLEVQKPALDVRLTQRPSSPKPEAEPAPAPNDPETELPLVANDEELPPVERVVPVIAPGQDLLGALLGSAGTGDSGSLFDLLPDELRTQLPGLIEQLATLGPRISDATLTVRGPDGEPMLSLVDAGFSAGRSELGSVLGARAAVYRAVDGQKSQAAKVDLEATISKDLTLESLRGKVSGRSIANQVARFVPGLSVQDDAEVDLTLSYSRPASEDAPHHVEGEVSLARFSFEFWRIADREIKDLQAKAIFDASIDRKNHRLILSLPRIEVGESQFTATLDLTRKPKKLPRFTAKLSMPRQDCGAAARSIPKGLIPNLSTLELTGEMEFDMTLDLDLANPRDLTLRVTGDTAACNAVSLGPGIDPNELRGEYVHVPREPKRGVLEHIRVGPGTPEWVPMSRIPPIVLAAAWITEDRKYREHGGVRWDLVQTALKMDLDHGRFIYGGSTITQQLVKNLYLTRDKNLARKLEEMIIAWHMERVLTKDEILTLYVNCIEYGPDIYGIRAAARAYFDKRVDDLDPLEAAFIMGLKPYPKAGYNQFLKGRFDEWWVRRVSYVLRLISKYEPTLLTLEQAEAYAPYMPQFRDPPVAAPSTVPRSRRR